MPTPTDEQPVAEPEVEAAARMRVRYLSTWSALLGKEVQVQLFGESSCGSPASPRPLTPQLNPSPPAGAAAGIERAGGCGPPTRSSRSSW